MFAGHKIAGFSVDRALLFTQRVKVETILAEVAANEVNMQVHEMIPFCPKARRLWVLCQESVKSAMRFGYLRAQSSHLDCAQPRSEIRSWGLKPTVFHSEMSGLKPGPISEATASATATTNADSLRE
jgi:hypothetical protein